MYIQKARASKKERRDESLNHFICFSFICMYLASICLSPILLSVCLYFIFSNLCWSFFSISLFSSHFSLPSKCLLSQSVYFTFHPLCIWLYLLWDLYAFHPAPYPLLHRSVPSSTFITSSLIPCPVAFLSVSRAVDPNLFTLATLSTYIRPWTTAIAFISSTTFKLTEKKNRHVQYTFKMRVLNENTDYNTVYWLPILFQKHRDLISF